MRCQRGGGALIDQGQLANDAQRTMQGLSDTHMPSTVYSISQAAMMHNTWQW